MRLLVGLVLVGSLVVPEAASASVPCQTALRTGAPDVITRPVAVSGLAHVSAALNGTSGDWDLAVFDADGNAIAAGASPDAQEVASGWARGPLTLQACRLSGPAPKISVRVDPITSEEVAAAKADAPELVSVNTPTRAQKDTLIALGLDMTEHGGRDALGVVLHGAADRAALAKAGLTYRVLVKDLVAKDAREASAAAEATTLPSGRTSYRTLADYESELKTLAAANPTLVRLITLPNKTFKGHDVLGIEIAENVTFNDGRPAFVNMGVHHAREWPAGELTMEWAYELLNGYKAGDPRATAIVKGSRNIVVPIVNPDGFEASRGARLASPDGNDETTPDEAYIVAHEGEYRRKNCRVGDTTTAFCDASVGLAENGVDINRNYAQFWGGPGSDTNPLTQTFRGPGPFSEPESRNIQWLVSHNQVMTLITNHTTAGLVLRAPGLAAVGDPVDENAGYKALGDAMAKENGYFSQKGFELYDTTGTTEDWSYNATGGYGFTFELYCGAPNYATGDCDKPAFHPRYATMAKEWDGTSAQADHVGDPSGAYDGKGNREAYYIAAESTLNTARHSILEGSAPAGTRVKLVKDFKTSTFENAQTVDDHLETVYDVGASGAIRWHVNPSTRPVVAKPVGKPNPGAPGAPQSASGTVAEAPAGSSKDHAFTVPRGGQRVREVRRVVGHAGERLGHRALQGSERQRRGRRGRPERRRLGAGPDDVRADHRARPGGRVRAAGHQLRRDRGLHGQRHLHRAAAVPAGAGRGVHDDLRDRRRGDQDRAGGRRARRDGTRRLPRRAAERRADRRHGQAGSVRVRGDGGLRLGRLHPPRQGRPVHAGAPIGREGDGLGVPGHADQRAPGRPLHQQDGPVQLERRRARRTATTSSATRSARTRGGSRCGARAGSSRGSPTSTAVRAATCCPVSSSPGRCSRARWASPTAWRARRRSQSPC